MPRVVSFLVLLAVIVVVGAVFFRVMAPFIVPLFLAGVLLVVFQPLHGWVLERIPGYPRIAALTTTLLIGLVVLVPVTFLGWNAYLECQKLITAGAVDVESTRLAEQLDAFAKERGLADKYQQVTGKELDTEALVEQVTSSVGTWLGGWVLSGVQAAVGMVVSLFIMVIALYYFLVDGPAMVEALMRLSPLDDRHERELLARFGDVSRAVVVATLLSAVVQGLLAGIGYYFALPGTAPIFLLTALTMLLSIVPFIGAAGMWVPVCLWLYLFYPQVVDGEVVGQGSLLRAAVLAGYCAVIVSGSDNLIKPLVLHGRSNLHPLLALLSILGGVTVLGPVGILVGPMLVSFLQALLGMFHEELDQWGGPDESPAEAISEAAEAVENQADRPATPRARYRET